MKYKVIGWTTGTCSTGLPEAGENRNDTEATEVSDDSPTAATAIRGQ